MYLPRKGLSHFLKRIYLDSQQIPEFVERRGLGLHPSFLTCEGLVLHSTCGFCAQRSYGLDKGQGGSLHKALLISEVS